MVDDLKRRDLLLKKIRICEKICDFSSQTKDIEAKEIKTKTLNDLISMFSENLFVEIIDHSDIHFFLQMIESNVIRTKPHIDPIMLFDRAAVFCDSSWNHIFLNYQIIFYLSLHFQTQFKLPQYFLRSLLSQLNFPDERERDQIVQFFLVYMKYHPEQSDFILKCLSDELIFYHEQKTEGFSISSILKIIFCNLSNAIHFLKPFQSVLAPLLSCPDISSFYGLLLSIINYIITYDRTQTLTVMYEMINRFPISPLVSQVIRISMLNKLIESLTKLEFSKICNHFFNLYARCINSRSARLVVSAFQVFSSKAAKKLFSDFSPLFFQIIYPAVSNAMQFHWNPKVKGPSLIALKAIQQISPADFEKVHHLAKMKEEEKTKCALSLQQLLQQQWTAVLKNAAERYNEIDVGKMNIIINNFIVEDERLAQLELEHIITQHQKVVECYYF